VNTFTLEGMLSICFDSLCVLFSYLIVKFLTHFLMFVLVRLIGAILIMSGLYLVVMGKSWENQALCQQQQHMISSAASDFGDEEDYHNNKPRSPISQPLISS